jgi:nucleoside-diphosphate-sugar epimerase
VSLEGRQVLVTGATGFVGSSLIERLAAEGARVVGLTRSVPRDAFAAIDWVEGSLEDAARMVEVTRGIDTMFHVGGMVGHFGSRREYLRINVGGTRNIIDACAKNGVRSLVFTSTPSVIADGTGHFGIDETHPYSRRFESPYSESKALAEQVVRAANSDALRTVCIRPHMIWGPGSGHWIGGLRKLAKRRMLYQIGDGSNRVGITWIDDCVSAHVNAWRAVEADAAVGGQAFFVHGGAPVRMWDWVRELTRAMNLPGIRGRIPRMVAKAGARACDAMVVATRGSLHFPISAYLITELTTDHYSRIDRARAWLGYEPAVTVEEGIARIAAAEARSSRSSAEQVLIASISR